ncbi:hypothetical protein V6N13_006204 [Hibiscus sabdariffa]
MNRIHSFREFNSSDIEQIDFSLQTSLPSLEVRKSIQFTALADSGSSAQNCFSTAPIIIDLLLFIKSSYLPRLITPSNNSAKSQENM